MPRKAKDSDKKDGLPLESDSDSIQSTLSYQDQKKQMGTTEELVLGLPARCGGRAVSKATANRFPSPA